MCPARPTAYRALPATPVSLTLPWIRSPAHSAPPRHLLVGCAYVCPLHVPACLRGAPTRAGLPWKGSGAEGRLRERLQKRLPLALEGGWQALSDGLEPVGASMMGCEGCR